MSHPGATPTTSPARSTCSTRSTTPSPPPATATAPRRPSSLSAFRRPADIRESSNFRRDTKDPSHHRLVTSWRASGCERVREFVDAPPHGCIAESAHCLAPPRPRAHRFSRRRGAGRGRSMGRVQRDPRGVARMPLRARRGGGEELLPLPGVAQSARNRAPSRAPLREFSPGRPPTRSWSRAPGGRTL